MPDPRDYREGQLEDILGELSLPIAGVGASASEGQLVPEAAEGSTADELRRAEEEQRERAIRERALRRMREGDAPRGVTMNELARRRNEGRSDFDRWFQEHIGDPTRAGAAVALDTLTFGTLPTLAGGLNEAAGVGGGFTNTREQADEGIQRARVEHPYAAAGGTLAAMPALMLSPTMAATEGMPALSRLGAMGLEGAAYGAIPGLARGDTDEAVTGSLLGLGLGAGGGALAEGASAAVPRVRQALGDAAERLDEWSAPIRARAAGVRGIAAQRRADAVDGGTRQFVQDLDRLGISPRGSLTTVDDAGRNAAAARQRAIEGIQEARDRMATLNEPGASRAREQIEAARSAVAADDPSALFFRDDFEIGSPLDQVRRRIIMDRVGRSREAGDEALEQYAQRLEAGDVPEALAGGTIRPRSAAAGDVTVPVSRRAREQASGTPLERRAAEVRRRIEARRASPTEVTRLPHRLTEADAARGYMPPETIAPQGPQISDDVEQILRDTGLVDGSRSGVELSGPDIAKRLRGTFERYRDIPGAESVVDAGERLAGSFDERPTMPWGTVEETRRFWDDVTNWQPRSPTSTAPLQPLQGLRRQLRRELQGSLDDAVSQHAPDIADSYRQSRRDYQVSNFVDELAREDALRDASNRLISPSDYGAMIGGASAGGAAGMAAGQAGGGAAGGAFAALAANRAIRGREHALSAAIAERGADAMRGAPARILGAAEGLRQASPRLGLGASVADPGAGPDEDARPSAPQTLPDAEFEALLSDDSPLPEPIDPAPDAPQAPVMPDDEFEALLEGL